MNEPNQEDAAELGRELLARRRIADLQERIRRESCRCHKPVPGPWTMKQSECRKCGGLLRR